MRNAAVDGWIRDLLEAWVVRHWLTYDVRQRQALRVAMQTPGPFALLAALRRIRHEHAG